MRKMARSTQKAIQKYLLNTLNDIDNGNWHVTEHTLYPYITNDKTYIKTQAFNDSMVLLIFHKVKRKRGEDIYTHDHIHDIPLENHDLILQILKKRVITPRKVKDKLPIWWNNDLMTRKKAPPKQQKY